ncbi:hypothetical protein [Parvularcula sp. LCG005]|uniref:hypothetical protein n=1 Tax=Parvularcula sp. LCG005 TaxID=3078805 RepID=UPI002942E329|nr:hypothetical protein [Parvularcula sp. LCG005]WOI54698.1 hypothetical protein RUI03_06765 [Parvularcula sp. LCG005]
MGWRGNLRSFNAAVKAAKRDAQRRQKAALKDQIISAAEAAVDDLQEYINELTTLHVCATNNIDWLKIANSSPPVEPRPMNFHRDYAQKKLTNYKPTLLRKILGQAEAKRLKLQNDLNNAPVRDDQDFKNAMVQYESTLGEWQSETDLAKRVLQGEPEAMREVIEEFQSSMTSASLTGKVINFKITNSQVHAVVEVHTDEIIPKVRRRQLQSGKLSETKMPVKEFNALYQDYVCSAAIKIAGHLFAILPQTEVYVTCTTVMLDKSTGHQETTPILSVQFVQETFLALNHANIDPSDSMKNFNHHLNFTSTRGFKAIEPLSQFDT